MEGQGGDQYPITHQRDETSQLRNENLITRPFVVTASAVFWRAKALTTNLSGEVI